MGATTRDSCREILKILKLLQLPSQYIFSLAMFVNNKGLFMENYELYTFQN
jgi:dTDP-4-dehydrorhamnose 3,5-epimerase-like enzyme